MKATQIADLRGRGFDLACAGAFTSGPQGKKQKAGIARKKIMVPNFRRAELWILHSSKGLPSSHFLSALFPAQLRWHCGKLLAFVDSFWDAQNPHLLQRATAKLGLWGRLCDQALPSEKLHSLLVSTNLGLLGYIYKGSNMLSVVAWAIGRKGSIFIEKTPRLQSERL